VLAVARAIASLDTPPRRSVLFALWDAEEVGLLGSKHWLENPTLDAENVRLMINCDMVGRLRNDVLVAYGTRTAAGLRQHLALANPDSSLKFNFDWRQRSDSDHWPFFERGVPYLLLHTGDHEDYHRPSDDPDKVNYEGLAVISQLLFNLTCRVADSDTSPTFREQSQQEKEWHQRQAQQLPPASPSRLGISWSNERRAGDPFVVTSVEPGSPAAAAGLRAGDRIIRFAGQSVAHAVDLVDVVLAAPQQTSALVERAGRSTSLEVPLTLRGGPVRLGLSWKEDDAEPGVAIVTSIVPGSPAARAEIEPLDRLSLPIPLPGNADWLRELSNRDSEITLYRDRRGQTTEVTLQPLTVLPSEAANDSTAE
jgi:membrane-associated protease RseP (regulator of RpoE activity)